MSDYNWWTTFLNVSFPSSKSRVPKKWLSLSLALTLLHDFPTVLNGPSSSLMAQLSERNYLAIRCLNSLAWCAFECFQSSELYDSRPVSIRRSEQTERVVVELDDAVVGSSEGNKLIVRVGRCLLRCQSRYSEQREEGEEQHSIAQCETQLRWFVGMVRGAVRCV